MYLLVYYSLDNFWVSTRIFVLKYSQEFVISNNIYLNFLLMMIFNTSNTSKLFIILQTTYKKWQFFLIEYDLFLEKKILYSEANILIINFNFLFRKSRKTLIKKEFNKV